MSYFIFPLSPDVISYRETVTLDGAEFRFHIRWNHVAAQFFCDVYDVAGELIVAGRKCVVDWPLFRQIHYSPTAPTGDLACYDTTQRRLDPAMTDLGSRVIGVYLDAAGLASLLG